MRGIWLIVIVLCAGLASAAQIDTAITTIALQGGFAQVRSQYVIISQGVEDLKVSLPADVREVYADMDDQQRTCKIENGTAFCGSTKGQKHVFTIAYESEGIVGSLGEREVVKFSEVLPFRASEHTLILKLVRGSVIAREIDKDEFFFVTPKPTEVLSDGQRIIVTWKSRDVEQVSMSAVTEPVAEEGSAAYIALTIAAVFGGAATYVVLRRRWRAPKEVKRSVKRKAKEPAKEVPKVSVAEPTVQVKAIAPQFVEDEQRVVELLRSAQNQELWQKQLVQETAFSKAKLSRIVRNLEERGVITKQIFGNTNKIGLKKEGR
ncbi:hypothetical protein C4580_00885 [Candidatus Woesearchaeota archaeon]|nr:MAG: hypothetical protein C4580_00885 [Candidatus Woesearchaeota archaeon]